MMHSYKRVIACVTIYRSISSYVHMNIKYIHRVKLRHPQTDRQTDRQTGIPFRTEGCIRLLDDIAFVVPTTDTIMTSFVRHV